jgi:amidase
MYESLGALCPHGNIRIEGAKSGPLNGLTFAAKDIYDVAGAPTGAGNPQWLTSHAPASAHAWAVKTLLDAGATLHGKTITDELAYGMTGRNHHYGAPVNPAAPDRNTGGSSCGSASAVAGKAVDFALGSDTGGSVRIPGSYCGLFGLRPTHGRIPIDGVVALSPSFDTVGWFAREPRLLERVGRVLLGADDRRPAPVRILHADDAFAEADPAVITAIAPLMKRACDVVGGVERIRVCGTRLADWAQLHRVLSAKEAWESDGPWITKTKPLLGPDVQERFDFAATLSEADVAPARSARREIRAHIDKLLGSNAVLCLPTAPAPAPLRQAPIKSLDGVRMRNLALTCISGLAGVPQITLPAGTVDGGPVGLSLIGPRGSDHALLRLAVAIAG